MSAFCVFNIGDRRIGIPMTSVREIVEPDFIAPTPIPLTPEFMHGLFNLRGQVLPFLDLASFVGATRGAAPATAQRAVIVERGDFRFATLGEQIDTIEAEAEALQPLAGVALHPALDAVAETGRGRFQLLHLDRLEACLKQALKFSDAAAPVRTAAASTISPCNDRRADNPT